MDEYTCEYLGHSYMDEPAMSETLTGNVADEGIDGVRPEPTSQEITTDVPVHRDVSRQGISRKSNRRNTFTTAETFHLIYAVRNSPLIWNLQDANHQNAIAVQAAFRVIATLIRKDIADCKSQWKYLRESRRYRLKQPKNLKSGSAGGEPLETPYLDESSPGWQFETVLSFILDVSGTRQTIMLPTSESELGMTSSPVPQGVNIPSTSRGLGNISSDQASSRAASPALGIRTPTRGMRAATETGSTASQRSRSSSAASELQQSDEILGTISSCLQTYSSRQRLQFKETLGYVHRLSAATNFTLRVQSAIRYLIEYLNSIIEEEQQQ